MQTRISFRRIAATAALLAGLSLGATLPAGAATIGSYGYWTSVVNTADGQPVCGVRTQMNDGAELRLLVINDEVHLLARDPGWHMTTGDTSHVALNIDGHSFDGEGTAIDGQTLMVTDLTDAFITRFIGGTTMLADFGGVHWNVSLVGSGRATGAMGACVAYVHRGEMS